MAIVNRERLRTGAIVAALVAGGAIFVGVVQTHYSVSDWLFWTYAGIWTLCAGWAFACLAAGHLLLSRVLRIRLPLREQLLMAFASGVLVFGTGVFVAGLLGPVFFCGWPLVLIALGSVPLLSDLRKVTSRARSLGCAVLRPPHLSWPHLVVLLFGIGGLALLYLQILTPANVAYDARWYHLGVAEQYVFDGRIARFHEGWFQGTLPQLATWHYTWAMLVPRSSLFFEIELAAHLEFTLFLATLVGVPLLVRWLTRRRGHAGSWVAVFLFPGIFLYDSNLNLGADHVLAFWAIPIALAVPRLWNGNGIKGGLLLGMMLAGAALTKYQAVYLVAGAVWLVAFGLVRLWTSTRLRLPALAVAGAMALVLTSPHWLKNWGWYDNPLYPFMHSVFGGTPWAEGAELGMEDPGWRPTGTTGHKLAETLDAVFTFSFDPHDWEARHGNVPVFGSLFTLTLMPLVFLKRTGRIWGVAVAALIGVAVWYWTYHQDRYLQALVPYMAAVTASIVILLWRTRVVAVRVTASLLIALQVVWGGDVPFLPTHAMIRETPYHPTLSILSTGYRNATAERYNTFSALPNLAAILPPEGTFLFHEEHLRLGLQRHLIVDGWGLQGAIVYKVLGQPRAVHERLCSLGITHVVWTDRPRGLQRMTDDLVFYEYVRQHTRWRSLGGYHLSPLPETAPIQGEPGRSVTVVGCRSLFTLDWEQVDRRWKIGGFGKCRRPPVSSAEIREAVVHSGFLIVHERFRAMQNSLLADGWLRLFRRDGSVAFARRRSLLLKSSTELSDLDSKSFL